MRTKLEYTVTKDYSGVKPKVIAKSYILTGTDEALESFAKYLNENLENTEHYFMDDYLEILVRDTEEKNDVKDAYNEWKKEQ